MSAHSPQRICDALFIAIAVVPAGQPPFGLVIVPVLKLCVVVELISALE